MAVNLRIATITEEASRPASHRKLFWKETPEEAQNN